MTALVDESLLDSRVGVGIAGRRSVASAPGPVQAAAPWSVEEGPTVERPTEEASHEVGWHLTDRGLAVVMGLLSLVVILGGWCVVASFLAVTGG